MSSDSATRQWTLVLVLTALFLSLVVVAQIIARYGAAYWAAPREIAALLDSADSSLHENESYDRDVAKVARRDDKIRLGRLLGEIQRAGDDLREDLNNVMVIPREDSESLEYSSEKSEADIDIRLDLGGSRRRTTNNITSSTSRQPPAHHISSSPSSPRLKTSARILWAAKRTHLEERLRRLDLLRMRFLVVYMSIVAATATAAAERVEKSAEKSAEIATTNAATAAATAARANAAAASTLTARNISATTAATNTNARRVSRSTSSQSTSSSDDDSSCSSSSSSAANSPLISATPSMPSSPSPRSKTTADIVAASIAAAAAAAMAAGDTDDVYYPSSPTSMPGSPGFGHTHPFLRSIQQQQQQAASKSQPTPPSLPSPPATPHTGSTKPDDFDDSLRRKPPSRRVTTLGIRPPDATPEHNHRAGWMGVVQELQRSPLLHKRHTSIEMSMARR